MHWLSEEFVSEDSIQKKSNFASDDWTIWPAAKPHCGWNWRIPRLKSREDSTNCLAVSIDPHVFGLHVAVDSIVSASIDVTDVCWLACEPASLVISFTFISFPSWWLNQPLWKILVKMGIFPNMGENKKTLKPPTGFYFLVISCSPQCAT